MSNPPPNINEPTVPTAVNINLPPPEASTFLANLSNIDFKDIPLVGTDTLGLDSAATTLQNDLVNFVASVTGQSTTAATSDLNNYFATINGTTNLLPSTFNSTSSTDTNTFVGALVSYLQSQNLTISSSASSLESTLQSNFETYYTTTIEATSGNDLSLIQPAPSSTDFDNQFQAAFAAFVSFYPYASNSNSSSTDSLSSFMSNLFNFTAVTARVASSNVPGTVTLATYEAVYNAFIPNPPPPGVTFPSFGDVLSSFYSQQITQQQYFLPSQAFGQWVTYMQQTYTRSFNASAGNFDTSVDTASSKGVVVLDKVLIALIQVINTLQNVGAAQAERLNFLTQWQQAYTAEGNQVHYFINGTDELSPSTLKQNADVRNNLNSSNQNYSQQIQANQNTISDDAKSLQSNVNQTNSDVNNESDLGSAIFQQLSTILTSIFQG